MVDISQLPKLGKVAGVPGIALGAAVLLLGAVLAAVGVIPEAWRGPVLLIVTVGAVLLALLTVHGWARGTRGAPQVADTEGDNSAASNLDKTKTGGGGGQFARTKGQDSPASNVRG